MTKALYQNPVYPQAFPDPFVLHFRGEYWAFCTGFWPDGRIFGVLHSKDLIHWQDLGGAMAIPPFAEGYPCYWAPEVIYANGKFYMYYSVGNEERMQIRVSVADDPAGPYIDSGYQLTNEEFAIDAHVFTDTDGQRYLFYATDFLNHTHIGTGTVKDQMLNLFTLAGTARPVTRARYDWQVYDPQRAEKKGVRWHTVEGPTVLKHKGRYYQMFSGGNWKNLSYGVSYALSESIEAADEWRQIADGERVLPILRTIPGSVIGPGHNSVVRGPDKRQLFCVYHFWPPGSGDRVMAVDRLEWAGERLIVIGPTTEPQPAPLVPSFVDDFDRQSGLGLDWRVSGGDAQWEVRQGGELFVSGHSPGIAEAVCRFKGASFLLEVNARSAATTADKHGGYGLSLTNGQEDIFRALIIPENQQAVVSWVRDDDGHWDTHRITFPADFDAEAWHLLRLEVDELFIRFSVDEWFAHWQGSLSAPAQAVALCVQGERHAAYAAFSITAGWEDLFTSTGEELERRGWKAISGEWSLVDQQLLCRAGHQSSALITRGPAFISYEFVVAARFTEKFNRDSYFGFYPTMNSEDNGPLLTVEREGSSSWVMRVSTNEAPLFLFPGDFDPEIFQQFRFRKFRGELSIQWEIQDVGTVPCPPGLTGVGLCCAEATSAAFDTARVTAIQETLI